MVHDTGACVLDQGSQIVEDKARQSLTGAAGAEPWPTFSQGELLSHGIALAICVVSALLRDLDKTVPGDLSADGSGRIAPMALHASAAALAAPACSNPATLLAHDRAVDFLERYGVEHTHRPAAPAVPVLP